nr:DEAD/DEAH box helicase family protein [Anaerovibrio slackiae]
MVAILSKKQMSEEDIKFQYITPAITAKWDSGRITMETRITDGRVNIKGNVTFRENPKRVDYLLYFRDWFAPDFFDLIIVDECHRGSAKEESRWRRVLG